MARVRPARHYQHPAAPIRRIADEAIPRITRSIKGALKFAQRQLPEDKARYLVQAGRYRDVAHLLPWDHQGEVLRRPMGMIGDVWMEGGELGERKLNGLFRQKRRLVAFRKSAGPGGVSGETHSGPAWARTKEHARPSISPEDVFAASIVQKDETDMFNFDRFDPVTMAHIRAFQDALITELGTQSRDVIERTVLDALRRGYGAEEIVNQIRLVIGLNAQQATALVNFRRQLQTMDSNVLQRALMSAADSAVYAAAQAAGRSLSEEVIERMVLDYQDRLLDYRAGVIATTEATRAASLGLQDSYDQAVRRGALPAEAVTQHWQISLDERTCDGCLSVVDMNPEGVPLGQMFESDDGPIDGPPYHPNCRCSLEFVTNLDLVPDESVE